jgi:hypothetical protein
MKMYFQGKCGISLRYLKSQLQQGSLEKGMFVTRREHWSRLKVDHFCLKERITGNEMCEFLANGLTFGNQDSD